MPSGFPKTCCRTNFTLPLGRTLSGCKPKKPSTRKHRIFLLGTPLVLPPSLPPSPSLGLHSTLSPPFLPHSHPPPLPSLHRVTMTRKEEAAAIVKAAYRIATHPAEFGTREGRREGGREQYIRKRKSITSCNSHPFFHLLTYDPYLVPPSLPPSPSKRCGPSHGLPSFPFRFRGQTPCPAHTHVVRHNEIKHTKTCLN